MLTGNAQIFSQRVTCQNSNFLHLTQYEFQKILFSTHPTEQSAVQGSKCSILKYITMFKLKKIFVLQHPRRSISPLDPNVISFLCTGIWGFQTRNVCSQPYTMHTKYLACNWKIRIKIIVPTKPTLCYKRSICLNMQGKL